MLSLGDGAGDGEGGGVWGGGARQARSVHIFFFFNGILQLLFVLHEWRG